MYLEEGDILYINPDYINTIGYPINEKFISIENVAISRESLIEKKFKVTKTRVDGKNHDICIGWLDGLDWWWGQIGYSEPWTKMFITEKQYLRNIKIEEICQTT